MANLNMGISLYAPYYSAQFETIREAFAQVHEARQQMLESMLFQLSGSRKRVLFGTATTDPEGTAVVDISELDMGEEVVVIATPTQGVLMSYTVGESTVTFTAVDNDNTASNPVANVDFSYIILGTPLPQEDSGDNEGEGSSE